MVTTASVMLDGAARTFDKPYTYAVPSLLAETAKPGCRAVVPFGRGNLKKQCMIISTGTGETSGLKQILSVTDKEPVLNHEMIELCGYLKETLFCTYFEAVHAMLPAGLGYKLTDFYRVNPDFSSPSLLEEPERAVIELLNKKGEMPADKLIKNSGFDETVLKNLREKEAVLISSSPVRRMGFAADKWVRLNLEPDELQEIKLTPKQREVAELVCDAGALSVKEICYFTGVSTAVTEALIKKNILTAFEKEVFRTPQAVRGEGVRDEISLTCEQNTAFQGLLDKFNSASRQTALLYGVTGSGKTQVFLKLADAVSDSGRGVIIMVPEIALTPQMIDIFSSRYGSKIAIFHSAMPLGQRMDEWRRVKKGDAMIAIGTRSAVFAPFDNLGLVIIDEEQEHTYKSEKSPRFHAREVAQYRTAYHKGLLCLASATPSIQSYTAALSGKYSLFTLKNRYGNAVLPEVATVDMRKEILSGNSSGISRLLYDEISHSLSKRQQVILLLNRRGHNTYISCADCGYVAACPNCSISLTYHSANERMMCHYCSHSEKAARVCPQCSGSHMKFMGLGTQKVEEELKSLFPEAGILRVDADSTLTRESYSTYLTDFKDGKYDIMLGTQMVAKGLDFPNVTLVGVLGADQAMYSEDYRSFERTFSLLTQVVGRAGRGETPGKAVIQTISPDGNVIELARRQDYESFYKEELATRRLMIYPPYCDICVVGTMSPERETAEKAIKETFLKIKNMVDTEYNDIKLIILGPAAAALPKVNNRYRFRMILKCKNSKRFREMLRESVNIKATREVTLLLDINPESVI